MSGPKAGSVTMLVYGVWILINHGNQGNRLASSCPGSEEVLLSIPYSQLHMPENSS